MENEYIMTSIEIDEQFVDSMADASINDPEYMTDEERDEANDFDLTDEELEHRDAWEEDDLLDLDGTVTTAYQMSDEEQKGLEQYLDDTREDVPECRDALVNLFWNTYAGETSSEQRKLERADELRRAKENQRMLDRNPLLKRVVDEKTIENLNNHFNPNA